MDGTSAATTTTAVRANSISQPSPTLSTVSAFSGKAAGPLTNGVTKMAKPPPPLAATTPQAPRVDMQPYHDALKTAVGREHWPVYTETLNKFFRGKLNNEEMTEKLGAFLKTKKEIRLHNSLIAAMFANITRDNPPTEVAVWISASDKPSSSTKLPAGDVNERNLKKEVMAISARERRRIKEIPEPQSMDVEDMLGNMLQQYHMAKQIKHPEDPPPKSATLNKTNWESEIKQRYTLPLASESGEFPEIENIRLRMLPICYEEGIPGGCSNDAATFMNVAAETFVKEILSTVINRVRSNGPNYVHTEKYRKLSSRNRWHPEPRPLLTMHDLRLSLTIGDNYLSQLPLTLKKIMAGGWYERDYEVDPELQFTDEDNVQGWEGGGMEDRKMLRGLMDDCLSGIQMPG